MTSSEESHVMEEQLRMSQDEDDVGLHSGEQSPSKLTIRDQIRLKKEKQKQDEEAQFTFRPAVNQTKKPQEETKSNRFDKLYGDALKRHMTGGTTKGPESPTKSDKELTFKPKLSSMGAKQSRSSSRERLGITRSSSVSKSRDASRERNGLASDSEDNQSQASSNSRSNSRGRFSHGGPSNGVSNNKQRGVAKVLEEQQASMTFRPSITKRAKSIEKQRQSDAPNVAERLYDQGKKVKEKMEQKKTELEQLRMQECTFAPSVVTKSKPAATNNLEVTERLRRFEEIKKKKLEEALRKKEEEEAEELTFKPKISPRAQSPSPHMTFSQEPLEERLMTPSKRRNSRAQEEATKELTFKPKLVAKRSPSPSLSSHDYGSIHERLFVEGVTHKRELELQAELKRQELDKDNTFTPELFTGSSKGKTRDSPDEHFFERLSTYQKGEPDKIERIRQDLDADLTFTPQLTRRSIEIASSIPVESPLYERLKAEHDRTKREMELRHQIQEEEKLKEATFQPIVPDSSKELAKRRLDACIDAGGDAASVFSMSVHSRLASMYTVSSANQSLAGTLTDNGTIVTDFTGMRTGFFDNEQVHPRQMIVLPEDKVNEMVRRLAVHKKVEEPASEVRTKVLPPQQYEEAVNRLAMHKTMSFTLKTDATQLEAVQPKLIKEPPKVTTEQMNEILERLQSTTVSVAASTAEAVRESSPLGRSPSGRNLNTMSTSQFNMLLSTSAAGAAALHGSPSPTRRQPFGSPPKASFFGTPLAAIPSEPAEDEAHDESPTAGSPETHSPAKKSPTRLDSLGDIGAAYVEEDGSDEEEKPLSARTKTSHAAPTSGKPPMPTASPTKKSATASSHIPRPTTPTNLRGVSRGNSANNSKSNSRSNSNNNSAQDLTASLHAAAVSGGGTIVTSAPTPPPVLSAKSSASGEFLDDFDKKLQLTMAMLKPLDALPAAPVVPTPAASAPSTASPPEPPVEEAVAPSTDAVAPPPADEAGVPVIPDESANDLPSNAEIAVDEAHAVSVEPEETEHVSNNSTADVHESAEA